MHKHTICTIFSILFLATACATTDPQPVEKATEMDTAAKTQQNGETAAETQQETETETEPETETMPVYDAQITYADVSTWTDSIGSTWYTAIVEVENTGTATIMLSNCSMDVEDASGSLVGTMDMGTSVPEILEPGEIGYYVETGTIDYTLPDGYQLAPHTKFAEHDAPTRYPVSEVTLSDTDYFGVKAVCRVENDTSESASSPRVAIILLGADGHAIAKLRAYADEIAPGEKMGVECMAMAMPDSITAGSISGYVAYAEPMFQW